MTRWLVVFALVAALPAAAGEKVDLTPWLGVVPQVADFRNYELVDGISSQTVESVSAAPGGGWRVVTRNEMQWNGAPPLSSHRLEIVVPGDRVLAPDLYVVGMPIMKPKLVARLLGRIPGRLTVRRSRGIGLVSQQLGSVTVRPRAVGIEPLDTPALSFPSVLRVEVERVFRGGGVREVSRSREWYLAGVGIVASEWIEPLDGVPDWWLVAARINDIRLPPEEP